MPLLPSFRQLGFLLGGTLLAALVGCGKSNHTPAAATPTVSITGKVTYDRIPLLHDVNGVPTGLETTPANYELNLPAKYITVFLYRKIAVPDPLFPNDRTKDKIFFGREASVATADGTYSFTVEPDVEWMVEVQASVHIGDALTVADVNILADPNGITSTVPQQNRLRYCMRKAPDGSVPPTGAGVNHVVTSKVVAGSAPVVDFHIGVNDSWFLADSEYDVHSGRAIPRMVPGYSEGLVEGSNSNGYQKAGQLEAAPTGSRVIAILQSFIDMAAYRGTNGALAYITPGGPNIALDLHYLNGRSEPRGSYIEWDRGTYPQGISIDPNTLAATPTGFNAAYNPVTGVFHYFGSIQAGPSNDDAWDRAKIIALAAKSHLFFTIMNSNFYGQANPLGDFSPLPQDAALSNLESQMAMLEGLPEGIAAIILKNPYIADTTSTTTTYSDIRDLASIPVADRGPFCAPFYSALLWQLALKANGLPQSNNPSDWNNIIPSTISPFLTLIQGTDLTDTINIYPQLKAMQSALPGLTSTTSPITDSVILDILNQLGVTTGNLPWPRPTVGPLASFVAYWGADPISDPASPATSTIAPITLSMAKATPVAGVYGNATTGELTFARFTMSRTKAYLMDVELPGGTISNGKVEVTFLGFGTPDGLVISTYTFSGSTSTSIPISFQTSPGAASTWLVRVRMLSPTALQPDTTVKIKLVPAA